MNPSNKNPLIRETTKLLYVGNDHFTDKDGNLYAMEEVFAPLNRAKEDIGFVEYGSFSTNGGYHYYDYENRVVGNYELVVPNQYTEVQEACDERFEHYKEVCKQQKKMHKFAIYGGVTILALTGTEYVLQKAPEIYQSMIVQQQSHKDSKVSAIELYLTQERNRMAGTSELTNNPLNMTDEVITNEAEMIMKSFKTQYTEEELNKMFNGGILTEYGRQQVLKYLNEKISLYSTEINQTQTHLDQADITITQKTR